MWMRCTNTKADAYPYYGGRGITVCDRWRLFENFLADMGECPDGKSLDRVNSDGNYEPENCRWASKQEQSSNRRNAISLTHNGVTRKLTEWADVLGISAKTLRLRKLYGWSDEKIISEPLRPWSPGVRRSGGACI